MKYLLLVLIIIACFSCKDDNTAQLAAQVKESQKKEVVFEKISKNWNFVIADLQPQSQELIGNWPAWRLFVNELKQKPTSSIGAFQKKSKTLTKLADSVYKTIPAKLQKPSVKARLTVILTQCRNLELYINLQSIPAQKIVSTVADINLAINSFEMQLDEIIRKAQIPVEQGEPDLIKIMDTTRAIPDKPIPGSYMPQ